MPDPPLIQSPRLSTSPTPDKQPTSPHRPPSPSPPPHESKLTPTTAGTTAWKISHIREKLLERCPVRTRLVISKETFEQAVKELYGARKMMWGTWQKLMGMKPPLWRIQAYGLAVRKMTFQGSGLPSLLSSRHELRVFDVFPSLEVVVGGRSWKVIRHLSGPKRYELQLAHDLWPYQMPRSWPLKLIPGVPLADQFRTHVVRFSDAPGGFAELRSLQVLESLRRGWSDAQGDRIKTLTISCRFRITDVVTELNKADKQMFFADYLSLPLVEDLNLVNLKAFAREIQPNTQSLTIRGRETFEMPLDLRELMCDFDWSCFQNLQYLEISCSLPTGVPCPNAFTGTSEERRLQGYTNFLHHPTADCNGFSRWSNPPLRSWTPDPLLPHYTGPRLHLRTLTLWLHPSPFQREVSPSHILSRMTFMPHIRDLASALMAIVDEDCECTVKLGRFIENTLVVEDDTHLTVALREQMALLAERERMLTRTSCGP